MIFNIEYGVQKKATLQIKVNFPVTEILSQAFYRQCDIKGFFVNKFIFIILFCIPLHAENLNIMTYNVWYGFNKKENLALGQEWLNKQNIDVLVLQESCTSDKAGGLKGEPLKADY